jgi:hypothetical protein
VDWTPSPEPVGYDERRVAQLQPIKDAVGRLGLPLLRLRKILGILNALTMQVEDGGDSPQVNTLLLDALRAVLHHQVPGAGMQLESVLRAIDTFEQAEAQRWEQVRAGTLPPIEVAPDQQAGDLVGEGDARRRQIQQTRAALSAAPLPSVSTQGRAVPSARKPGRNDPCWCGSGKKYKVCHLDSDNSRT